MKHALIGIEDSETGAVRAIYCHNGGKVGHVLSLHYSDVAKVEALTLLGSLSRVGADVSRPRDADDLARDACGCPAFTVSWIRDWGRPAEMPNVARHFSDRNEFLERALGNVSDCYLYAAGQWLSSYGWSPLNPSR